MSTKRIFVEAAVATATIRSGACRRLPPYIHTIIVDRERHEKSLLLFACSLDRTLFCPRRRAFANTLTCSTSFKMRKSSHLPDTNSYVETFAPRERSLESSRDERYARAWRKDCNHCYDLLTNLSSIGVTCVSHASSSSIVIRLPSTPPAAGRRGVGVGSRIAAIEIS